MVYRYHQELHQKEVKAEKEESLKLKRIAGNMAKMVKEFWSNIERVCLITIFLSYILLRLLIDFLI